MFADRQPGTGTLDLVYVTNLESGSDNCTSLKCSLWRCSGMMDTAEPVSTTRSAGQEVDFAFMVTAYVIS